MHKPVGVLQARFKELLETSRFLKGQVRGIIIWPALALIMGVLGWWLTMNELDRGRERVEAEALHEVRTMARGYARNLLHSIDTVDQTLLHVRYEWELSNGNLPLENLNRKKLFHAGSLFQVSILDRNGKVVTSTMPAAAGTSQGNAGFFTAQKLAIIDFLYLGVPLEGAVSRPGDLNLSRGLSAADDSFAGVVVVNVAPEYFTALYDEGRMGQHGMLAMLGDDGHFRATRVGDTIGHAGAFAFVRFPQFPTLWGSRHMAGKEWFADGRARYVGWRQIEGYPLVAVAGFDQEEILAPYMAGRATALRNVALASIALFAFAMIALVLSTRLAWRKYQLQQTQATYRMATEEGHEGFYIASPVRERHRVITDFLVADCNSYGAHLFQKRREEVLGKHFSTLISDPERAAFMACLTQAMTTGFCENEFEVTGDWSGPVRWVYIKAVRASNELAITMRDITGSKDYLNELERRGNQDALTGLPNRYWIQRFLPDALDRARAEDRMLALLFIDLDGFKRINDTLGHPVGDELLRYTAERLKVAVRPHDHVIRLGGDEFVVIVEDLEHKHDAAHVADRVVAAFREKFRLSQGVHTIGTSIGISVYPYDGEDADTLLKNADIAMYAVKTAGKGKYRFYAQELYENLRLRVDREHALRQAIENDELVVYYQPRIDIRTGAVSSMEALVRWQHPGRGLIEPGEFIGLAEETGLIVGIGEQVLDKVCAQLAAWARWDRHVLPVSVNVSTRQFNQGNFVGTVAACIRRHGIRGRWLELEITESSMMGDSEQVSQAVTALQKMDIKLLIDDFGTGYSSLSQLQQLDFDVLKVDRAFTSKLEMTEEGKVFFSAIITMAHALDIRVVAEGVENSRQIEILNRLHCDEIQGFFIARPSPPLARQGDFKVRAMPALA